MVRKDLYLEIRGPKNYANRVNLESESIIIGRASASDLTLRGTQISRSHSEIAVDSQGRWCVRDLKSHNGTYVNGHQIEATLEGRWYLLEPGDRVDIGEFNLIMSVGTLALDWALDEVVEEVQLEEILTDLPTSTLGQATEARINPAQLDAIGSLGMQMVLVRDRQKRLDALIRFLLDDRIHGLAAIPIRLSKQQPNDKPMPLGRILYSPNCPEGFQFHISRSALSRMLVTNEPVLTGSGLAEGTEISVAMHSPMAAMACPLHSDDDVLDSIYLVLPPQYGTTDYLALVALAARLFQIAQTGSTLWES
jgi:sigma-B regulation protein RsbU (phosphoserine phosphatase)